MTISGVTTFLWFDDQALEAATFYVDTFPDSRLGEVTRYQAGAPQPEGSVLTVEFELFSRPFVALNGGPGFPHSEAVSFQVFCDTQDEVDSLWETITANGGRESMCGWCQDRFGVSWQIVPRALGELLSSADPAVSQKAFASMMTMRKIVIDDLR
ncbi:MAG: VOC family protein [Acidobacteriota bacterium]|nr:VOC family protein [Acidobacteriota bacterium]